MAAQRQRSATEPAATRPPARAPEMQDWLNRRIYHPLAWRLARALRPTGVSPNAVSVGGGLMIVAAALFYTQLSWPASALLGFLAHALWHVLDGADGDLARMTGRSSPFGELIDGICDYLGHAVLYLAFGAFLDDGPLGLWAWPLTVAAAVSHIVQANHAETGRRIYLWRVYGVPWLRQAEAGEHAVFHGRGLFGLAASGLARLYVYIAAKVTPVTQEVDRLIERASASAATAERVRGLSREAGRRSLPLYGLLGANWRTVLLGLTMLLTASPLAFLLVELTFGNLLLVRSVRLQKRNDAALAATLA